MINPSSPSYKPTFTDVLWISTTTSRQTKATLKSFSPLQLARSIHGFGIAGVEDPSLYRQLWDVPRPRGDPHDWMVFMDNPKEKWMRTTDNWLGPYDLGNLHLDWVEVTKNSGFHQENHHWSSNKRDFNRKHVI